MTTEKLSLQDKISRYLSDEIIKGIHLYKGQDYSFELNVQSLLFQTSGLPDFYLDGNIFSKVTQSDFGFSFSEELTSVKSMKPRFIPNYKNKAYYSDINFDLLGKIIEAVRGCTLQQAYDQYIFCPLGLSKTYVATNNNDFVPHIYYKKEKIERPQFIRSCIASGGGVTTVRELMVFLKAFYGDKLFDQKIFKQLETSNSLQMSFYPLRYAGGTLF